MLRQADPMRNAIDDPAFKVARAGVISERDEFDVWYKVEVRLQTLWPHKHVDIAAKDLDKAFNRYSVGRIDYF